MEKADVKILVADDMPMMRAIVLSILKKIGYKDMITANNGVDAYEKLQNKKFHLAIVDWMMPDLDGIGLLKQVRSNEGLKDLPILMLTAKSDIDEVKEALEAGANNYIIKPFTAKVLEEKIDSILGDAETVKNPAEDQ